MAFHTRSASAGSTVGMRFTARETVAIETPARRATSRMLTAVGRRLGFFLGLFTAAKIVRFLAVSQMKKLAIDPRNA
jgi:hypothetical protein